MNASLETRHYVATDADIARIAKDHTDGLQSQAAAQATFLRSLAGTTIAELKAEPRMRSSRERKLEDPAVLKTHVDAFEAVYARFYAVLVAALMEAPADADSLPPALVGRKATRKAIAQARATRFRSAASTLRSWIKAGYDVTALAPASVTRGELERDFQAVRARSGKGKQKPSGLDRVAKRVGAVANRLTELVREVAKYDPERATALISEAASALAQTRAEVTGTELTTTTTSLRKAAEQSMPLDFGNETFILLPMVKPAGRPELKAVA